MEIFFKSNKEFKLCSNKKNMNKRLGSVLSKKLQLRLKQIEQTDTLADLYKIPQMRCHQLNNDRDNQLAVVIHGKERLIFEPADDPVPLMSDGGFDRENIRSILILEVGIDYHGN